MRQNPSFQLVAFEETLYIQEMRKRMDRYIHDALKEFANWYVNEEPDWMAKERDCVNIFATRFLMGGMGEDSAIQHREQIRVECGVMQPPDKEKFPRPSATKDLVIWKKQFETTWDSDWNPVNIPRAVIEWKTKRKGNPRETFDTHDEEWLTAFTKEHPGTFGFLVSTHATKKHRCFTGTGL